MAVMEPMRKSPRSTMRDKMALRCCSSVSRESGKWHGRFLTYQYVRNIATKKDPLIVALSCRTPGHMVIQDIGDALWYAHFRLRYDSDPSGSIAASAATFIGRNCWQFLTVDRSHFPDYPICRSHHAVHLVGLRRSLVRGIRGFSRMGTAPRGNAAEAACTSC